MARLAAAIAPRYRVDGVIAPGGMACVFKGFNTSLQVPVALKVLEPDIAAAATVHRFEREGRVQAQLQNAHIVRVSDSLEYPGLRVLVMEFVDGESLKDALAKRGRFPVEDVRRIGMHLLDALQCAHEAGVVHRDVKPGNVLLRKGQALLADFGIASVADLDDATLTTEGQVLGTPAYMPTEQALGIADRRSDLFSLGLTLRQCLLGLSGRDVRNPGKDAWSGIPSDVRDVIERSIMPKPEDRWQSAAEFSTALARTAESLMARWRPVMMATVIAGLLIWATSRSVRVWLCQATHWDFLCEGIAEPLIAPVPQRNDLAILPFTGQGGREVSQQVGEDIRPFPVIKLWNMAKASAWWDSLPASQKDTPPAATRFYASGNVAYANGRVEARVEIFDSTGELYASIHATADTAQLAALSRTVADSVVCKTFRPRCQDFKSILFHPGDRQAIRQFFMGRDSVAKGNWRAGQRHFEEALRLDPWYMVAAWELMIAKRIRRENFSGDLQFIARNRDSLPPFYRELADASLTSDLRERFRIFEKVVRESGQNGTALLLYTNELFHRGALVKKPLAGTVDTMTALAGIEPEMNHSSTYDMAWWGELRLGREDAAWLDLERREALGPPPGDRYKPFQRLGTYARFSPWKANLIRALKLRSPDAATLASLKDFARLGSLMDIPEEQLALGHILVQKGTDVSQRTAGMIGLAGGDLMMGRPGLAVDELNAAARMGSTRELQLQLREWPVHLAALGLYPGSPRVDSARTWLVSAPLDGTDKARALYALGRDAIARYDTARAAELEAQLRLQGAASPTALRHADLLNADLLAARGDLDGALRASEVIYIRDTTLVRLSPFARATTYLRRGAWQAERQLPDSADAEWLWYESSDFEGWPSGPPQEGEIDAILSVYARLLRGELQISLGNMKTACGHLNRAREHWNGTEPVMTPLVARTDSARKLAKCR